MSIATISSKSQLTLPADVRDALGLSRGDKVVFTKGPDGRYVIEKAQTLASLIGIVKSDVKLTDEELRQAIIDARDERADELVRRMRGS
jgi:AbrB family looped-hinge helix DNA binding protein